MESAEMMLMSIFLHYTSHLTFHHKLHSAVKSLCRN